MLCQAYGYEQSAPQPTWGRKREIIQPVMPGITAEVENLLSLTEDTLGDDFEHSQVLAALSPLQVSGV
jgi:hypothetical protein